MFRGSTVQVFFNIQSSKQFLIFLFKISQELRELVLVEFSF